MVSVRRVAPILLLAVCIPAFSAQDEAQAAKPKGTSSKAKATSKKSSATADKQAATPAVTTPAKASTATTATSAKSTKTASSKTASRRSSSHPPRQLHMVGNHWTPYTPPDPSTYPAGAKTYTIVAGDTLWALGAKFYGNAYLWPQLWEANTWITDAHWIYPGDTLLVEGEGTTATTASGSGASGTTGVQPELTTPPEGTGPASLTGQMPATLSAPVPLGTEADIYCYAYIGDPNESLPNTVDSFEDIETKYLVNEKNHDQGVGTDEIIYIKGGTASGIVAGETYIVVAPSEMILHPVTKEPLGRKYEYRAQVKILCASEDKATAVVSQACTDVRVGDRLKPLPSIPIPIARTPSLPTLCDPPSGKTAGYIVEAKDFNYALGEGMLVQVNLGRDEMVQPGDFLTVFRDNPVPGAPRRLLGEIGILTAESHTATARIVSMHFSMQVGDRVEIR